MNIAAGIPIALDRKVVDLGTAEQMRLEVRFVRDQGATILDRKHDRTLCAICDKLPYLFEDRGEQSVKNIVRPVRVYALRPEAVADLPVSGVSSAAPRRRRRAIAAMAAAAAAALVIAVIGWWMWPATKDSTTPTVSAVAAAPTAISQPVVAPRMSIVVLPFANLNNDPEQQYFADAVTEDLTTDLSRISSSFVISRNTAFTYKDKPVNAKQIGKELGVRYVLEGSVRRSGNQVRINTQLIDAATGAHLWAERFDRDTGDLFALQNEITSRIAVALSAELVSAEAARPTENPDALDYILRGRAVNKPQSRDTYAEIIGLYERALALDPWSVDAQSRLATTLVNRVLDQMSDSAAADIKRAEGLIGQALAASPRFWIAHYAKAQLLRQQGRCVEAIPEYETVIALDRNFANAYANVGWCKFLTGSIEEAIPAHEQAIRLNPRPPNGIWYWRIGLVHLLHSRTDEAILYLERARSAAPELPFLRSWLASADALKGETERGAAELAEARRLNPTDRYSTLARVRANGDLNTPAVRGQFETIFLAGLRKAGMPEE